MNTVAMRNSLRSDWQRVMAVVNVNDGNFMVVGLLAVAVVVFFDSTVVRLLGFIIALVCGALVAASVRMKRAEVRRERVMRRSGVEDAPAKLSHVPEEGSEMKRLVFDDFQLHPRVIPVAEQPHEEVLQESPRHGTAPPKRSGGVVKKSAPRRFQVSDFFDVDSELFRDIAAEGNQSELRNEFDYVLNKILAAVKDVIFAHTVAYFWANHEKQQMICEAHISDSAELLSSQRFSIGHDVVSQIAVHGKPELITHVNPTSEKELLRYYERVEFVKSFVGVPVFYPAYKNAQLTSVPVGVLIADSTMEDAFGQETISLLGQFTKLISALIKTSTDKYDLLLDAELLNSIRRLQERIRSNFSVQTITQTVAEEAAKLLNWNFLSVVLYDDVKRGWAVKNVVSRIPEGYIAPEQLIDGEESIVGQTIKKNVHQVVQNIENQQLPRYYRGEKLVNSGSFVSVPISSLNKCYGALNVESRDPFNFSRKDIEILYRLAENAASALEILYLNEMIKEYVVIDGATNSYAKKFFIKKLQEELRRADDYGTELSLVLMSVDHSNKIMDRYGPEEFEAILADIVRILKAAIRPYDAVGRYDYNRLAVLLVNTAANDAYIWAEKMRKAIASHIMTIDGRSFSVTASIGVCGALEGMQQDEIINHATTVLLKGMESGGNAVRVY